MRIEYTSTDLVLTSHASMAALAHLHSVVPPALLPRRRLNPRPNRRPCHTLPQTKKALRLPVTP
jgi:hypothetical protein